MRKLILIGALAVTLLTGCSLIPQKFDNNEYELLARLETSVTMINENCGDAEMVQSYLRQMEYDARVLHTYAFYTPRNSDIYEIVDILKADVVEFKGQYEKGIATKQYCTLKSELFLNKVRTALEASASKPR